MGKKHRVINKQSYLKRFQTKLRRRREGKTDYQHRSNMVKQDANKQGIAKIRLVVRITNTKIICQLIKAYVDGDRTICYADSTQLKKYGINFGLTNYSAAYATGLLIARRYLNTIKLNNEYPSLDCNGEFKIIEENENGIKPVLCYLDIGLRKSSKGARVFAAMKGASDGGLRIPHSPKKFPGYSEESFNSEELRNRIFSKPLIEYMINMKEDDISQYKKQFSNYINLNIQPEDLESIYENAFSRIKEDPDQDIKETKDYSGFKQYKVSRLTAEERKARALAKKVALAGNK